jgi:hypothetical protein
MQQFSLHSSKVKIISSIIFLISACSIFFAFGILADNLIVKILSFLIFGFCFADLLLMEIIPKKVFYEDGVLELKYLGKNICITLKDVVWYSKNNKGTYTLFCKSNNNLCLIYHGKKHYVSVKEQDFLESYLLENAVQKSSVESGSSFKPNSVYGMYLYFKFTIIPFLLVQIDIRFIKIDTQPFKNIMFGDIMIMFFCVWVLFMVSIIDDITGKKNKEKTEEVGMEK